MLKDSDIRRHVIEAEIDALANAHIIYVAEERAKQAAAKASRLRKRGPKFRVL